MGARRAAVWRCRELVFNRRRFLYGLYRDCGAGASVLGGRLWLFALPFTIIVYPFIFLVMPKLWTACHRGAHVTAADFVQSVYGGRWFVAAIAATGIIATMPYIALQLVGMQVVIQSL